MRKPAVPVSTNGTQSCRSWKTRGITLIMYQEVGGSTPSGCATQIKSWLYENTGKKNYSFFLPCLIFRYRS